MSQNIKTNQVEDTLNKNAKEYIPSKVRMQKMKEFTNVQYLEVDSDEEEENDIQEKIDMIEKEMIESEVIEELGKDMSEDEDMWFPMYRNCECCKGFVFKCKGKTCADLGQCYCKMKDDVDIDDDEPGESDDDILGIDM